MRRLAVIVTVLFLSASCGRGSAKETVSADKLKGLAAATSLKARDFTWSLTMDGRKVSIKGSVSDDYRYQATVEVDSKPAYEEFVIDDARYLHISDPSLLMDSEAFKAVDPAWAAATRGWVVDPLGAPPEFGSRRKERAPLDAGYVLDRVRFLEAMPTVLKQGFREYNTDAINYLPKDDKFPAYKQDGTRFDHSPGAYDPNAITVTFESIKPYFEYVSVWATLKSLTRVEFLMELPPPDEKPYTELYRQIRRAGSRGLNSILASGPTGRKFAQTFTATVKSQVSIVPPADAVKVDLKAATEALTTALQQSAPQTLYGPLVGLPG